MAITPAEEAHAQLNNLLLPVGGATGTQPFAQTFDRRAVNNAALQPTSGTLTVTAIWLPAGAVVTGITFVSAGTGETGGTHLWYCLYKGNTAYNASSYTLMAQSADDTGATSFGTNTALRKALTAAQTCPYTGLYYIGYCSTNSAGSQPALLCNSTGSVNATGNITGMTPVLGGTADTGLTSAAPATLGSLTAIVQCLYAFVD